MAPVSQIGNYIWLRDMHENGRGDEKWKCGGMNNGLR